MHEPWLIMSFIAGVLLLSSLRATAAENSTTRPTTLPSQVFNWNEMAAKTTAAGERRALTQLPTATLDELEMHITTLNPGQQAHAPHRHPHEELILLKEGTLEAMINDQLIPMPAGSVLFIAPNDLHVVKNVGTTPATYFIVTWKTPLTEKAK
ncbi:MAG TPA: cupin domain-containing protein [Tepidisphaeraceae bacterium]|nr:cupin domain-containing protein [Tepidisphaeraceae bacterium]